MKIHQTILPICAFAFASAFAQQGRVVPPRAAAQAAEEAAGQGLRGIEKKDISRGMVIHRQGDYDPKTLQRIEEAARQLVDAIGSGAKLTKADAARTAAPLEELQPLAAQIRRMWNETGSGLAVVTMTVAPGAAAAPSCPNYICKYSVCVRLETICVCVFCMPVADSTARVAPGAAAQPSNNGAGLLVVAVPPGIGDADLDRLVKAGVSELRAMPESPQLVIKTKSVPPYTQQ